MKTKLLEGIEASFDYFVGQHLDSYPKVSLRPDKDSQIRAFVKQVVDKKRLEGGQYFKDPESLAKRYYTGWGGECAVEQYIGKPFVDFSIGD